MNPVILLSPNNSIRNATRKIFETLYVEPLFLVRNLPEAPAEIDVNEFIVSEAMKLACNGDERVFILGIEKKDVIEKGIRCDKFDSLVKFLPHPFLLPDIFAIRAVFEPDSDLPCKQQCTIFGERGTYLYSGNILADDICHEIKNILPLVITRKHLEKYINATDRLELLERLFVPPHEKQRIIDFISSLRFMRKSAHAKDVKTFKKEFVSFRGNKELLKSFPYLGRSSK